MNEHEGKRNILLYRLHTIFSEPLFWGPILITALQNLAHMPLADIYYMESTALGLCVVLDIPFGALADLIGRKKTICIGRFFLMGSVICFATMQSPLEAWLGDILWAIGFTLQSGADTALLYDTLKERGEERAYKRIDGQAAGTRLILMGCCALAVGVLAKINLRLPIFLGIPFMLIPLASSFFFKEPTRTKHYSMREQVRLLKQGGIFVLRSAKVCWMVGFAALLTTASKVWFFTYNPYFETVGVDIAYYGVIFFLLNVVAWLSSHYAYKIEGSLGERRCIIVMILCVGVPILMMGLIPIPLCAYLVIVQNVVRGFMRPFVGDYLHRHVSKDIRATVLSVQSSAAHLMGIVGLAGFGFLTGHMNLLNSLKVLGIVSLALGAWSFRSYAKQNA